MCVYSFTGIINEISIHRYHAQKYNKKITKVVPCDTFQWINTKINARTAFKCLIFIIVCLSQFWPPLTQKWVLKNWKCYDFGTKFLAVDPLISGPLKRNVEFWACLELPWNSRSHVVLAFHRYPLSRTNWLVHVPHFARVLLLRFEWVSEMH